MSPFPGFRLSLLLCLALTCAASAALFTESFAGPAGSSPNFNTWTAIRGLNTNNDIQEYTASTANIQLSGQNTLRILPRRSPSGAWTSGRIESKPAWGPRPGRKLQISASIRLGAGTPASKQGLWPAFWVLGDSMRHGTPWPVCAEMDIFEHRNADAEAHGAAHCGLVAEKDGGNIGGPCGEPTGRVAGVALPRLDGWHEWAMVWDRTPGSWRQESISWMKDGHVFHRIDGNLIGDESVWKSLAHGKYYIVLNVAIGGSYPGMPTDATKDGDGAMLEVRDLKVFEP